MPTQIGLESSPDDFIAELVEVFREVRRVLRDDGTLWLNLGDSYAGGGCGSRNASRWPKQSRNDHMPVHAKKNTGLKPKDLIGIPWRVAFALQADGWYLRQDIIWHKPNPMPESVIDRCTKAHEYIFLLSKSPRYHFDADAIQEPIAQSSVSRLSQNVETQLGSDRVPGKTNGPMKAVGRSSGNIARKPRPNAPLAHNGAQAGSVPWEGAQRNKRSVWTVSTKPFSGAHFAVFPSDLIAPCILAGCPIGGTVLDPFFGSGTTGMVASRLQRKCVGLELNPAYAEIAENRIRGDGGMFTSVEVDVAGDEKDAA